MKDDPTLRRLQRLAELKRERLIKLSSLGSEIGHSLQKGYDFAQPNLNLFTAILQLEAQIRELTNL